jgi:hypothetical protein
MHSPCLIFVDGVEALLTGPVSKVDIALGYLPDIPTPTIFVLGYYRCLVDEDYRLLSCSVCREYKRNMPAIFISTPSPFLPLLLKPGAYNLLNGLVVVDNLFLNGTLYLGFSRSSCVFFSFGWPRRSR